MKALRWHGKGDIRCDTVPDPIIEEPRDAIIRVTSCAICGSDLHLYNGFIPGMEDGDILGHEFMGEVVEVGADSRHTLKVGDRVVVPFTICCGSCEQCRRGNFSVCERSNRKAHWPPRPSAIRRRACSAIPISPAAIRADRRNMSACPMPM